MRQRSIAEKGVHSLSKRGIWRVQTLAIDALPNRVMACIPVGGFASCVECMTQHLRNNRRVLARRHPRRCMTIEKISILDDRQALVLVEIVSLSEPAPEK